MPEIPTYAVYLIAAPFCILGGIFIYILGKRIWKLLKGD